MLNYCSFSFNIFYYFTHFHLQSFVNTSTTSLLSILGLYKEFFRTALITVYIKLLFRILYVLMILLIISCFYRFIAYFGQQISDLLSLEWHLQGKQNLSSKRTRVAIVNYQTDIDTLGTYFH